MKQAALPLALAACPSMPGAVSALSGETLVLTDAQLEELVRRSCHDVAMFIVNRQGVLDPDNPQNMGGDNGDVRPRPRYGALCDLNCAGRAQNGFNRLALRVSPSIGFAE